MKCPKCSYLGFETGDRCKNCGYDFSLMSDDILASEPEIEYDINSDLMLRDPDPEEERLASQWLDELEVEAQAPRPTHVDPPRMVLVEEPPVVATDPMPVAEEKSGLPLFARPRAADDEPLVRAPAAPRQPLAVRRTPDATRPPARHIRRQTPDRDHVLLFGEEPDESTLPRMEISQPDPMEMELPHREHFRVTAEAVPDELRPSGIQPRIVAALIDHGILLAIDLVVIYFTLRMAALGVEDWRVLPPTPLLAFLGMVKLAYFGAFTAVGGQTIGKMAAGIRVVTDDAASLDVTRALQRAAAVLVSLITLGIGFLPALVGSDRRALHDRVARTRVVTLPSA